MNQKGLIVFVTFELFPFDNGGIGRFCYNALESMTAEEKTRTLIILTAGRVNPDLFSRVFPGVRFIELEKFDFADADPNLAWAMQEQDRWLAQSVKLLAVVRSLARKEAIDYIEFTDYGGPAFATIEEKRLTGFLAETTIAVRLHSTETILALHESRLLAQHDLARFDLERLSLQNCDLIAGHLPGVAEITRHVFGLDRKSWEKRLFIAEPPLTLNGQTPASRSIIPALAERIVFSSKLQEFKRPEVFVRGVARFLATDNAFAGQVAFAFAVQLNAYVDAVLGVVPQDQRHRYVLPKELSALKRDEVISNSIVVFPTAFESYCFAAYEAAALGSVVVLNHRNPGFDKTTRWKDGVNCITFDGTAAGLAAALSRCIRLQEPLEVNAVRQAPQAWHRPPPQAQARLSSAGPDPKLTVLIVNQSETLALPATLESLASSTADIAEVIVIDDGSTESESAILLPALAEFGKFPLRVVSLPVSHGYAGALGVGLEQVQTELVSILRSGNTVKPDYLQRAVSCLGRNKHVGIVCGQVRIYRDIDEWLSGTGPVNAILGDAALTGTFRNSYGEFGMVVRTKLACDIGFRSETGYLCDWAFVRQAVGQGAGIVASPEESIGRRAMKERDSGTPIDEFDRLKHIVITHIGTPVLNAPVMRLAEVASQSRTEAASPPFPYWYGHAMSHGYEGEVQFMAEFFGHTRLGRLIRRNNRVSAFLERLVNRISNWGPRE